MSDTQKDYLIAIKGAGCFVRDLSSFALRKDKAMIFNKKESAERFKVKLCKREEHLDVKDLEVVEY